MNVHIVSRSMVSGTVVQQALLKVKDFNVSISFDQDQQLIEKLNSAQNIDLLVLINDQHEENSIQKLNFLHQLFGSPIIVLGGSNSITHSAPWLKILPDFCFNPTDAHFTKNLEEFLIAIKTLSGTRKSDNQNDGALHHGKSIKKVGQIKKHRFKLIAIGASTGGPQILNYILKNLPARLPVPILVVQHMPANFLPLFIEWLDKESPLKIVLAQDDQPIKAGHVYFAPGNFHMVLKNKERIKLIDEPPMHSVKPAVSYLFKSVAEIYGDQAIGILLTGMGKDGAKELGLMKDKGALTIVQNKESCVVFGMPGAALESGAAQQVLAPEKIVDQIKMIFNIQNGEPEPCQK